MEQQFPFDNQPPKEVNVPPAVEDLLDEYPPHRNERGMTHDQVVHEAAILRRFGHGEQARQIILQRRARVRSILGE